MSGRLRSGCGADHSAIDGGDMHWTTLTSVAKVIWRTLEAYRLDPEPLFVEAGLQPELLQDANARYPVSRLQALWTIATERTGDPCFGLCCVDFWQPTSFHALGYAWMASSTLADALQRLERYLHLVVSSACIRVEQEDAHVAIRFENRDGSESFVDASVDAALALLIDMCRLLIHREYSPAHVEFMREEPPCRQRYYELFRSPIRFGASANRLVLKGDQLDIPLPGANSMLARANEQLIHDYLARFDQISLSMLVRSKLVDILPAGNVTEEKVARALNMSVRSLQRHLREEGSGFKLILDAMRQDLARDYVAASDYSVNEIAYLLGFSEPGNFTRAFKRWHGVPPSQYKGTDGQASA